MDGCRGCFAGLLRTLLPSLPPRHHLTRLRRLTQRRRCHNDAHPATSLPQRRRYRHPPALATGRLPPCLAAHPAPHRAGVRRGPDAGRGRATGLERARRGLEPRGLPADPRCPLCAAHERRSPMPRIRAVRHRRVLRPLTATLHALPNQPGRAEPITLADTGEAARSADWSSDARSHVLRQRLRRLLDRAVA
jgi:hypothetical protein